MIRDTDLEFRAEAAAQRRQGTKPAAAASTATPAVTTKKGAVSAARSAQSAKPEPKDSGNRQAAIQRIFDKAPSWNDITGLPGFDELDDEQKRQVAQTYHGLVTVNTSRYRNATPDIRRMMDARIKQKAEGKDADTAYSEASKQSGLPEKPAFALTPSERDSELRRQTYAASSTGRVTTALGLTDPARNDIEAEDSWESLQQIAGSLAGEAVPMVIGGGVGGALAGKAASRLAVSAIEKAIQYGSSVGAMALPSVVRNVDDVKAGRVGLGRAFANVLGDAALGAGFGAITRGAAKLPIKRSGQIAAESVGQTALGAAANKVVGQPVTPESVAFDFASGLIGGRVGDYLDRRRPLDVPEPDVAASSTGGDAPMRSPSMAQSPVVRGAVVDRGGESPVVRDADVGNPVVIGGRNAEYDVSDAPVVVGGSSSPPRNLLRSAVDNPAGNPTGSGVQALPSGEKPATTRTRTRDGYVVEQGVEAPIQLGDGAADELTRLRNGAEERQVAITKLTKAIEGAQKGLDNPKITPKRRAELEAKIAKHRETLAYHQRDEVRLVELEQQYRQTARAFVNSEAAAGRAEDAARARMEETFGVEQYTHDHPDVKRAYADQVKQAQEIYNGAMARVETLAGNVDDSHKLFQKGSWKKASDAQIEKALDKLPVQSVDGVYDGNDAFRVAVREFLSARNERNNLIGKNKRSAMEQIAADMNSQLGADANSPMSAGLIEGPSSPLRQVRSGKTPDSDTVAPNKSETMIAALRQQHPVEPTVDAALIAALRQTNEEARRLAQAVRAGRISNEQAAVLARDILARKADINSQLTNALGEMEMRRRFGDDGDIPAFDDPASPGPADDDIPDAALDWSKPFSAIGRILSDEQGSAKVTPSIVVGLTAASLVGAITAAAHGVNVLPLVMAAGPIATVMVLKSGVGGKAFPRVLGTVLRAASLEDVSRIMDPIKKWSGFNEMAQRANQQTKAFFNTPKDIENAEGVRLGINKAFNTVMAGTNDRFGLSAAYIETRDRYYASKRQIENQAEGVVVDYLVGLDPQQQRDLYNAVIAVDGNPLALAGLRDDIRNLIDGLSLRLKEALPELGGAIETNLGTYFGRVFKDHLEAESGKKMRPLNPQDVRTANMALGISSNAMKHRGLRMPVSKDKVTALLQSGELAPAGSTKGGKKKFTYNGHEYWLEKEDRNGTMYLRRDWTDGELDAMGLARHAGLSFVKVMEEMSKNVPTYEFYKSISEDPNICLDLAAMTDEQMQQVTGMTGKRDDLIVAMKSRLLDGGWVEMPGDDKTGSVGDGRDIPRYGALSGKWVERNVARDVQEIARVQNSRRTTWDRVMRQYKQAHTIAAPAAHTHNVIGNMMWHVLHGGRMSTVPSGIASYYGHHVDDGWANVVAMAKQKGVYTGNRLSEIKLNWEQELLAAGGDPDGWLTRFTTKLKKAGAELYGQEDDWFRLSLFKDMLDQGIDPDAAAREVNRAFIDYNISAPWINRARESVMPFLAWGYRATPLALEAMTLRPEKFLLFTALGAAYGMFAGADTDEGKQERASMDGAMRHPEYRVRMPFKDGHGQQMYLDTVRAIPLGELASGVLSGVKEFSRGEIGKGLDEIGQGIASTYSFGGPGAEVVQQVLNKDLMTGKPIVDDTDPMFPQTTYDLATGDYALAKRFNHAWQTFASPLQGGYHASNIWKAISGLPDRRGQYHDVPSAVARLFGVKLDPVNVDLNVQTRVRGAERDMNDLRGEINAIARNQGQPEGKVIGKEGGINSKVKRIEGVQDRLQRYMDAVYGK